MKKTLWKQSSRSLRMEQLENRELLSATTWSNAIDADAAVAAEMSTALSNATVDDVIDLTEVTTLQDVVDPLDRMVSLREALKYIANDATLDGTITFNAEKIAKNDEFDYANNGGYVLTLTQGELEFTNNSLATVEMPNGRYITIDASDLENGITIDAQGKSRVFNVFATQDADPFVPTFKNLTIVNGAVTGDGAAIYADGYTVTLADCDFEGNVATGNGGAVYAKTVSATNSTFTNNSAFTNNEAGGNGGAIYTTGSATATNSTFTNNEAGGNGGAIYTTTSATATNATFTGNTATGSGGAIWAKGQATVTGSNFSENTANVDGGAIYAKGKLVVTAAIDENGLITATADFEKNQAGGNGGAIYTEGSNSSFTTLNFVKNEAAGDGGGIYASGSNLKFENLTVDDNTAGGNGGGIHAFNGGNTLFKNLTVTNNNAVNGGGLYFYGVIYNSLIANNTATADGGGFYDRGSSWFYSVTIVKNTASRGGGVSATYGNGAYSRFYNSIILANISNDVEANHSIFGTARPIGYNMLSEFDDWRKDAVAVSENTIVYTGDINNVFTDAANGDYTLKFSDNGHGVFTASPAIGAGNNKYVEGQGRLSQVIDLDLAGNARVQKNTVDLGAFESPYAILAQPNRGEGVVTVNPSISETLSGSITIKVDPQEGATAYSVVVGTKDGWIFDKKVKELGAITETTSVTFDDLLPNKEYIYWVLPIGGGEYATPELANPLNDVYTTNPVQLATPKLDDLVTTTADSITIDFAQDNQSKADSYFVLYQKVGDAGWTFIQNQNIPGGQAYTISGLDGNSDYNVMAFAVGDGVTYKDSLFSNAFTFKTLQSEMPAATITATAGSSAAATGASTVTINFAYDGGLADKHIIQMTTNLDPDGDPLTDDAVWTTIVDSPIVGGNIVEGLDADKTYYFRAVSDRTVDDDYKDAYSEIASVTTAQVILDAPSISVEAKGVDAIELKFNDVANASGYVGYFATDSKAVTKGPRVTFKTVYAEDGSVTGEASYIVDDTKYTLSGTLSDGVWTYTFDGLAANTEYFFQVRSDATSPYHISVYSSIESATTDKIQLAVPGNLKVTAKDQTSISIKFDAVANANKYLVEWQNTVTKEWGSKTITVLNDVISDLAVGTKYDVFVTAVGEGDYSDSEKVSLEDVETTKYAMPSGLPTINVVSHDAQSVTVKVGGVYEKVPAVDEEGNPILVDVLDKDGKPVYEVDGEGNPVYVLDGEGKPVCDEDGNPVQKVLQEQRIDTVYMATNGYAIEYVLASVYNSAENKAEVKWDSDKVDNFESEFETFKVEGLTPNRDYLFRVVALETGEYYASTSKTATVKTDYLYMSAPSSLKVEASAKDSVGTAAVKVNIGQVPEAVDTTYTVEYRWTKGENFGEWTLLSATCVAGENLLFGLDPCQTYEFRAQANTNADDTYAPNGEYAYTEEVTTSSVKLNKPTVDVDKVYTAKDSITVDFNDVDNAAFYVYQYRVKGSTAWSATSVVNGATAFTIEDLDFGTPYEILLQAVQTGDYLPSDSITIDATTVKEDLERPTLTSEVQTSESITVNISFVANATSYTLEYKAEGATDWVKIDNLTAGANEVKGLAPNTKYVFKATAVGDDRYESITSYDRTWTTKKGSVTLDESNVVITTTYDSITIDVNLGDKSANYPYFVIQYRDIDNNKAQWIYETVTSDQLAYTISGLNMATRYAIAVEAIGDANHNNAQFGGENYVVTTDKLGVLDAPSVSATQVDDSTITVTLGEVVNADHGYTIEYSTGNGEWTTVENAVVGVNTITGLLPNQTYVFRAFANETALYSASEATDATATTKPQTPGAITFSQYKGGAEGALDGAYTRVRWAYCDNAPTYELWYAVSGSLDWTVVNCDATLVKPSGEVDTENAGAFLYDLTPGVEYTFMVRAVDPNNAENVSDFSASAMFRMMASPKVAEPTFDPTTGKLQFSWSTDEANVTKYRAEVSTTEFTSVNLTTDRVYSGTNTSFEFNSLNAAQTYYFRVCAYNADGVVSGWTYSEYSFTAPSELSFTQYQDWVRVRWADVENESGYRVEYRAVGETEWTLAQTAKANATSGAIYGLTAGTTYEYRVVATFNKVADGAASEATTFAMLAAPTVNEPTFSATGDRVTFTWDAVEGAVTYRVELSGANLSKTRAYTLNANTMKQDFTSLAAGTYTFRVRANQASGEGNSDWTTFEFTIPAKSDSVLDTDVVSEAFVDLFAEEAEDDFWFEFEEALGGRSK